MRHCWKCLAGAMTAAFCLIVVCQGMGFAQGMMDRGGRMMGGHMREMMQRMMGDMLPPPMDPALLPDPDSDGAKLLQQFCTQCHNLPGPGLHTAAEWPAVVERMNRRMRMMGRHSMMMMGGIETPTERELATIRDYLESHAQKPLTTRLLADLQNKGGKAFGAFCSQCHVLPDPGWHTSAEWPAVVERMMEYMARMGKLVPDEETVRDIVDFLQRHGSSGKQPRTGEE